MSYSALKVINKNALHPDEVKVIRGEAKILEMLVDERNIVQIKDVSAIGADHYFNSSMRLGNIYSSRWNTWKACSSRSCTNVVWSAHKFSQRSVKGSATNSCNRSRRFQRMPSETWSTRLLQRSNLVLQFPSETACEFLRRSSSRSNL